MRSRGTSGYLGTTITEKQEFLEGMIMDFPAIYTHVQQGKMRGLAMAAEKRMPLMPEISIIRDLRARLGTAGEPPQFKCSSPS